MSNLGQAANTAFSSSQPTHHHNNDAPPEPGAYRHGQDAWAPVENEENSAEMPEPSNDGEDGLAEARPVNQSQYFMALLVESNQV